MKGCVDVCETVKLFCGACSLSNGVPHARQQILGQYLGFTKKLMLSKSPEIRMLAELVVHDVGSVTRSNLLKIEEEFGADPWSTNSAQLAEKYSCYPLPAEDEWRLPLLLKLLDQRRDMSACEENTKSISELIDSLCHT